MVKGIAAEVRGFAVVDGGGISVRTFGTTRRAAMVNWMFTAPNLMVASDWSDDKIEEAFARYGDHVGVIEVRVMPVNAEDWDHGGDQIAWPEQGV